MSMIEAMRGSLESTSTRILIGVVALLFVVAGGDQMSAGCAGGLVAQVNGEGITIAEYENAVRMAYRQADGQLDEAGEKELADLAYKSLIEKEVMLQLAGDLGVAVSDEELARVIVKEEAFMKDGKFDEATYAAVLKENGRTRSEYEVQIREAVLLAKLQDLLGRAAVVSEAEVKKAWQEGSTELELTFVRLAPESFYGDIAVSDADLSAYLTANAAKVKARYDEDFERAYNLPRRYTLHSIVLRTDVAAVPKEEVKARAEAILAEAKAGADFAQLAKRWSEDLSAVDGGALGVTPMGSLDPVIVAAADAAGAGQLTPVLETGRGFQLIRVEAIEDPRVISLEEAQKDIALRFIKAERAPEQASAYASKIIAAWQAGQTVPRELADAKSLEVDTTGTFRLSQRVPKLGGDEAAATLLSAQLATAKPGDVLPLPLNVKGVFYAVGVTARTDGDPADYAEQGEFLRRGLEYQRRKQYIEAVVAGAVAEAKIERYRGGS